MLKTAQANLVKSILVVLSAATLTCAQAFASPQGRGRNKPPKDEQPPSEPAIVYTALNSDQIDLMVMDVDGSNQEVLFAQAGVANREPSWSPDGSKVVFFSDLDPEYPGIYIIDRDGSGPPCKVVQTNSTYLVSPAWSPAPLGDHGYKIAYSDLVQVVEGEETRIELDIYLVDPLCPGPGKGPLTPFNLTGSSGFKGGFFPTWSPDASQLAAHVEDETGGSDIVVYGLYIFGPDVKILNDTNLTEQGDISTSPVTRPDWSRAGDKIAVEAGSLTHDIWIIELTDPSNPEKVTDTPNVHETMPSWSPDDLQIVFRRDDQNRGKGKLGIYRIDAGGTGLTKLAGTNKSLSDLWDPDWRRCSGPYALLPCEP